MAPRMETIFKKEQNKKHVNRPNTTNVRRFA